MSNLILLIGTNPLPNYVVAEYFIKNKQTKKIWLLHSEEVTNVQGGTKVYAEKLRELLQAVHNNVEVVVNNLQIRDIGNGMAVQKIVKEKIINELQNNEHVHLNYTGGTKAMGVHSYIALKNNNKNLVLSFSYLDARKYQIIDDEGAAMSGDIRNDINISFNQLIKLHGFERKNKDSEFQFQDALNVFTELIKNDKIGDFYGEKWI